MNLDSRLERISKILEENKGENTESFNLKDRSYMVDGVVIATAMADKHLQALLNFLKNLKPDEEFLNVDIDDNWIVVDLGDILVHLMTKDAREKYNIENFLEDFGKTLTKE